MTAHEVDIQEVLINGVIMVPKDSVSITPVLNQKTGLWVVGKNYFVRTVTYHFIGKLAAVDVDAGEMLFTDACWVASSGRWNVALTTGVLSEVEPFPKPLLVNRDAFIDGTEWTHSLPREVK